jgi:hypothetical protein
MLEPLRGSAGLVCSIELSMNWPSEVERPLTCQNDTTQTDDLPRKGIRTPRARHKELPESYRTALRLSNATEAVWVFVQTTEQANRITANFR